MIIEDYVSFEVAKLLKEKGFNELCFRLIREDGEIIEAPSQAWNGLTKKQKADFYLCPTLQTACKWLREVHSIVITIDLRKVNQGKGWGYIAVIHTLEKDFDTELLYADYAHCIDEAIKYTLENLI